MRNRLICRDLSAILVVTLGLACGEAQPQQDASKITNDVDFTVEKPSVEQAERVLATYCAGSGCHSAGSEQTAYVDDLEKLRQNASIARAAIRSGSMPPTRPMPVGARQTLLNYIDSLNTTSSFTQD